MILKTEIAFNNVMAEKLGIGNEDEFVFGVFYLDLKEVAGFGEFVKDGLPDPTLTEVTIKNIGGRILNIPVAEFKTHMENIWGKLYD